MDSRRSGTPDEGQAGKAQGLPPPEVLAPRGAESEVKDLSRASPTPFERLALSANHFRALYAASPTAVGLFEFEAPIQVERPLHAVLEHLFAAETRCIEANRSFARTFGIAADGSMAGGSLTDIFPPGPENRAIFRRWIENDFFLAYTSSAPVSIERGGGSYELSMYPVFTDGCLACVWVLFRDVSDLQHALDAAQRAEEHYRTLVERPGLILVRTRPDGSYIYITPHVNDIIGYTPDDFQRNPGLMEKLLHPEDIAKHAVIYEARAARSRETVEVEFRVRRRDGVYQWFLERQTPMLGPDGEVCFYDSVAIDITERKHLEAQLLHSQRLDVMGRISSGIAHDFNNHLTGIIGQIRLGLAALEPEHPAWRELRAAESAAVGCVGMTRQLLAFGRKSEAPIEKLDLAETVEATLQLLRHFLPSSIELRRSIEPRSGSAPGNASQIQQVVMNLGINARDAMPGGGVLSVGVGSVTLPSLRARHYVGIDPGDYIEVSVTDTGSGMSPTIAQHAFEPFFTTKPAGAGTGLGLSMVKSIITAHGGALALDTAPGRGTTVSFVLPVSEPVVDEAPPPTHTAPPRGAECILVAEDDSSVLHVASTALDLHGYSVLKAEDGESAIRVFEENAERISLVLVDQTMPKRSGLEVLEALRKKSPRLPVIFTSGHGRTGELRAVPEDTTTAFMGKPYSLPDLLRLVRALLDKAPLAESPPNR